MGKKTPLFVRFSTVGRAMFNHIVMFKLGLQINRVNAVIYK